MGKLQNNTKIRKWKIIVVNAQGKQDNANPQTDARDYARLPCLGYIQEAKPMHQKIRQNATNYRNQCNF